MHWLDSPNSRIPRVEIGVGGRVYRRPRSFYSRASSSRLVDSCGLASNLSLSRLSRLVVLQQTLSTAVYGVLAIIAGFGGAVQRNDTQRKPLGGKNPAAPRPVMTV